jgi:PRTRC genetic system protein E
VFQELMPLLAQRVLVLTLSRTNGDEICVNVIPRPLQAVEKDANVALTTPLSITGTPAELDLELPKQLVEYVGAHLGLSSTLKTAQEEMAAAAKTAKEAVKKSATAKSDVRPAPVVSNKATAAESSDSTEGNSNPAPEPANAEPAESTGNLFEPASTEAVGIG